MKTLIMDRTGIEQAAEIIKSGGLVAFPTETVYGLGGDALNPQASEKIYAAKGRPSDNPLIVHVCSVDQIVPLVQTLTEDAEKLMKAFWPGPLTIILPKSELVPEETTGGLQTVALRMPEHAYALELIEKSGTPIAAPSANTSGRPSPTEAAHVYEDLNGKIEMILDGGTVGIGVESTIIDLSGEIPALLRPGAITREELSEVLGKAVEIDPAILSGSVEAGIAPKAPGMKYRHYAPEAQMHLVQAAGADVQSEADRCVAEEIIRLAESDLAVGKRVGILCCEETEALYDGKAAGADLKILGSRQHPLSMTHNLYRQLRAYDTDRIEVIYAEAYSDEGVGFALMNRMRKAAGGSVLICRKHQEPG